MKEHLFVYGTLQPGESAGHLLQRLSGSWQRAFVRGWHKPEGIPETEGYPALMLDAEGPEVAGWLLTSEALNAFWEDLDAYEGDAYIRTRAQVRTEDGQWLTGWIYAVQWQTP